MVGCLNKCIIYHSSIECDETGALTEDIMFFQEEGLEGTFVIDLGVDLDNSAPILLDEIVDPNKLAVLARQQDDCQEMIEEYEHSDDEEELDADCYDEVDY